MPYHFNFFRPNKRPTFYDLISIHIYSPDSSYDNNGEGLGHLNKQSPRCKANKLVMRILFRWIFIFFPTFCDWRWAEIFLSAAPVVAVRS